MPAVRAQADATSNSRNGFPRRGHEGGEVDLEPGSSSRFAFHHDGTAVLLDDPVHHRQTKPRPHALRLGGEKRLEYPLHDLPGHSRAGIRDRQTRILAYGEQRNREVS